LSPETKSTTDHVSTIAAVTVRVRDRRRRDHVGRKRRAKSGRGNGFTHIAWPTKVVTAEVEILGLDEAASDIPASS
jgi:hypothetical protein